MKKKVSLSLMLFAFLFLFSCCGGGEEEACNPLPRGNGAPEITFTKVPPFNSTENLIGMAWNVSPEGYGVAVLINVDGLWWSKPTNTAPVTSIACDGSFTCDVTTGGNDQSATEFSAFLIPIDYAPPIALGTKDVPPDLYKYSVAVKEEVR